MLAWSVCNGMVIALLTDLVVWNVLFLALFLYSFKYDFLINSERILYFKWETTRNTCFDQVSTALKCLRVYVRVILSCSPLKCIAFIRIMLFALFFFDVHDCWTIILFLLLLHLGLSSRKPVFGVSEKVIPKPAHRQIQRGNKGVRR